MREYETVRLYGKVVNRWYAEDERGRQLLRQVEVEYKEYEVHAHRIVAVGTEDFSAERYRTLLRKYVYTWDGHKYNKGGHRWFDCEMMVTYVKGKGRLVMELLKSIYMSEDIGLRRRKAIELR